MKILVIRNTAMSKMAFISYFNVLRFVSTYYCLVFCFMDDSNPNLLYLKRLELQHGHVYSHEAKLPRTNEVWSPNRYMRNFISIVTEE